MLSKIDLKNAYKIGQTHYRAVTQGRAGVYPLGSCLFYLGAPQLPMPTALHLHHPWPRRRLSMPPVAPRRCFVVLDVPTTATA
jgi:hypothetical protein